MKKALFLFLSVVLINILIACTPNENLLNDAIQKTMESVDTPTPIVIKETVEVLKKETTEVEITKIVEVTRMVEVPVTVTYTPGPSPTPTITPTPTPSQTPKPTATPFQIFGCINLQSAPNFWRIKEDEYDDKLYPFYVKYNGKCVKFFFIDGLGVIATDYGMISIVLDDITIHIDKMSPSGIKTPLTVYSTVWGIWEETSTGKYQIRVRRIDEYLPLQQPILDDGFYMVGEDFDLMPGQWKSLWPPGMNDGCYWARTNPDSGDIKDNHYGMAGIYVRIYAGDLFESDDCAPWVFVQP